MSDKYILLSHWINNDTPVYGNTPAVKITKLKELANGDGCNTAWVCLSNHAGTHIDAPLHFDNAGKEICDYSINKLIFNSPYVINCPKDAGEMIKINDLKKHSDCIKKCDALILNTGFCFKRNSVDYRLNNPALASETAAWLRNFPNLRAVGIDAISISSIKHREEGRLAHSKLLSSKHAATAPIILIEDLDLTGLSDKIRLKKVFVMPLFVEGLDAAPCTVVAQIMNE